MATSAFESSVVVEIDCDFTVQLVHYFKCYIYIKITIHPSSWFLPCLSFRPSCPALFLPQPNTAPDKERAKLWSPPAVICAKGIPARDLRGWGNSLLGSPFPRPSWPLVFWPHVNSWPSEREKDREAKIGKSSTVHCASTGKCGTI